jgi:hypothetical protein
MSSTVALELMTTGDEPSAAIWATFSDPSPNSTSQTKCAYRTLRLCNAIARNTAGDVPESFFGADLQRGLR